MWGGVGRVSLGGRDGFWDVILVGGLVISHGGPDGFWVVGCDDAGVDVPHGGRDDG